MSNRSLAETAAALRSGAVSAVSLAEAAIAAHEESANSLGAYKTWSPELARSCAAAADAALRAGSYLGPLHGIPVSVKDLFLVSGLPTFGGTPRALPAAWSREGPIVSRMRAQMAAITGKTHTVELAFGGLGVNPHWGTPVNPWDSKNLRVPGGSSSGAGVSLLAGSAMIALGSDTGGSVRIPASMTGTVGLKTTVGRWSTQGIVPLSTTLDTPGVLTRSVADAAWAFAALDPAWGDPHSFIDHFGDRSARGIRVGIADRMMWENCSPGIEEALHVAIQELEKAGCEMVDILIPEVADCQELLRSGSVVSAECESFLSAELPEWKDLIDPIIRLRIDDGAAIPASEYLHRLRRIRQLEATARERLSQVDVMICPTVPITPPTVEEVADIKFYRPANMASLSNTCVGNFMNLCGLSIPAGLDAQGMPVGMQLLSSGGSEERLLGIGLAFEKVLGNAQQRLGTPSRMV